MPVQCAWAARSLRLAKRFHATCAGHWEERNATEWSRERLHELFAQKQLVDGSKSSRGVHISCTGVSSLTGDAYVNQRKGKLIPAWEVELKLGYSASRADGSGSQCSGTVHLPYVADENADEDPEVKILPGSNNDDSELAKLAKEALQREAIKTVISIVKHWESELQAGGPAGAHAQSSAAQKAEVKRQQPSQQDTQSADGDGSSANATNTGTGRSIKGWESKSNRRNGILCLMEEFLCRPNDLYRCLTEADRIKSFSRADASVDAQAGGSFYMFDSNVHGTFIELEQDSKIVQKWRFSNWPSECYSDVKITFEEPEHGKTFLVLEQSNIPSSDAAGNDTYESVEHGWRNLICQQIKKVFGFGY